MELTAEPAAATQDSGAETTPRPTSNNKPLGFLSYGNGALKRHYPTAPAAANPPAVISYKECLRNHAASMGGHALDGCCEFMPSPATYNPDDPTSLRCAACGCHRNFHRRDPDDPAPLLRHRPSTEPAPHALIASLNFPSPAANGSGGRKRFRTRFSEEQKEKMRGFSERFGWKMQKIEKGVVEEFCKEVGVGREVLKVWMHNHKNSHGSIRKSVNGGNEGGAHNHNHNPNYNHNGAVVGLGGVGSGGSGGGCGGGQFDHDVVASSGDASSSSSSSGFSI